MLSVAAKRERAMDLDPWAWALTRGGHDCHVMVFYLWGSKSSAKLAGRRECCVCVCVFDLF